MAHRCEQRADCDVFRTSLAILMQRCATAQPPSLTTHVPQELHAALESDPSLQKRLGAAVGITTDEAAWPLAEQTLCSLYCHALYV